MAVFFCIFVALYIIICPVKIDDNNTLASVGLYSEISPIVEKIDGRDYNGDGTIYREFYFENDKDFADILNQIKNNSKWRYGLLEEELYYKVNSGSMDNESIGKECYYYFLDRYHYREGDEPIDIRDYNKYDRKKDLRYSTNYTVAVLDIENRKLYYFKIDT